VRLFAFAALAAGYRGLGFLGDAELTRPAGKARLIELALLNAEIDLFEPILAQGIDPIRVMRCYPPDPKGGPKPFNPANPPQTTTSTKPEVDPLPTTFAAAIETRDHRGTLLVVADLAGYGQFQPPQMSLNDMRLRPMGPQPAQAYEVSLG